MGERFPAVTDRQGISVLRRIGFVFYRPGKGSHEIWRRTADFRHTTVPRHRGKTIKRRTPKAILRDIGLTVDEFRKELAR